MTEPEFLETDVVLFLHDQALREYGGIQGVKDEGMLHSALGRPLNKLAYADPGSLDLFGLREAIPRRDVSEADRAPTTSSCRSRSLPARLMPPRRWRPPAECSRGVKPSQAATWRADSNWPGSTVVATVNAVTGPTPGIAARR